MTICPLVSHEMPPAYLYNTSLARQYNDYHYVLLHLYEQDETYRMYAQNYPGTVYLDNSAYELGAALDNDRLARAVVDLKPDVYFLPDVIGDSDQTLERSGAYLQDHRWDSEESTPCGVVQGETVQERLWVAREFVEQHGVWMIALPASVKGCARASVPQMIERWRLLDAIMNDDAFSTTSIHLLGCWQPQEYALYRAMGYYEDGRIVSIDTSSPVMAAFDGTKYESHGLRDKPTSTLDGVWDAQVDKSTLEIMRGNCAAFRKLISE